MTLINDFFSIKEQNFSDGNDTFLIKLNSEHFIFKAHFPDNPITPGVCIVQIVKEIFENKTGKKFFLSRIKNLKFIQPIIPTKNEQVKIKINSELITNNTHKLKVEIIENDIVFTKFLMELNELSS